MSKTSVAPALLLLLVVLLLLEHLVVFHKPAGLLLHEAIWLMLHISAKLLLLHSTAKLWLLLKYLIVVHKAVVLLLHSAVLPSHMPWHATRAWAGGVGKPCVAGSCAGNSSGCASIPR